MMADLKMLILKALDAGPMSSADLAEIIGCHRNSITGTMRTMHQVAAINKGGAPIYMVKQESRMTAIDSLTPITRMIISWSKS